MMRTHAVPIVDNPNGSATSANAISASPTHAMAGFPRVSINACMDGRSSPLADALAEQPRRTEHEHGDQHEEREHVLVVRAEHRKIRFAHAALGEMGRASCRERV